jgi:hypothetical protein
LFSNIDTSLFPSRCGGTGEPQIVSSPANLQNKDCQGSQLTESTGHPPRPRKTIRSAWDLDRINALLKSSIDEIEKDHPSFFGTLKIEVNFREGQIETVIVDRRQTFKS